jgi:hypothetical protein
MCICSLYRPAAFPNPVDEMKQGQPEEVSMKRLFFAGGALCVAVFLFLPDLLWAGGEAATNLVVVADTRRVSLGIVRYIADTYNINPWLFACYAVIFTACYGTFLGFVMDKIMGLTGLDLRSRKILEH